MTTRPATRTHTEIDSPVGVLTAVLDDDALVGLYFPGHLRRPPVEAFGEPVEAGSEPGATEVRRQLGEYFAGERTTFDLPLAPEGDGFKQRVWARLRAIPYGETRTYGDLARELGHRNLAQAVGHANALNPISIVQPCHRVVGADGSLTGFAGGLERKRFLLDLEAPPAAEAGRLF